MYIYIYYTQVKPLCTQHFVLNGTSAQLEHFSLCWLLLLVAHSLIQENSLSTLLIPTLTLHSVTSKITAEF